MEEETETQRGEPQVQGHTASHRKNWGHFPEAVSPGTRWQDQGQKQLWAVEPGTPGLESGLCCHSATLGRSSNTSELQFPHLECRTNNPCPAERSHRMNET